MFRPSIVAVFREVILEGILRRTLIQFKGAIHSVKLSDFTVTSYLKEKLSKVRSFDRQ